MISRRKFFSALAAAGAAATVPVLSGLSVVHSRRPLSIWNDGGPSFRIGHISDFHSSPYISLKHIGSAIDLILADKPDLVCITGDFVNDVAPDAPGLVNVLRRLTAATPTFACVGNHDGGRWLGVRGGPETPDAVVEILHAAGVRVMRNESEKLTLNGRTFFLTGVEDLWSYEIDTKKAGFTPEQVPRFVLAHNPDTKDELARVPWDIMLSGHTHGGQIRLPFFGGRLTAPVRDDRYIEGLLPWNERQIHISRGVGSLYGLRINCPPETTTLQVS